MARGEALIIGCGHNKTLAFHKPNEDLRVTTLDHNPDVKPDVIHDLEEWPYPFGDNSFDVIEAIEVLEHIGDQGDWKTFFGQFSEFWRILKPNGELRATCPMWNDIWTWGDPSHRRIINSGTLVFLSQQEYKNQEGKTSMTDFRRWYKADFELIFMKEAESFKFVLTAIKPSRGEL